MAREHACAIGTVSLNPRNYGLVTELFKDVCVGVYEWRDVLTWLQKCVTENCHDLCWMTSREFSYLLFAFLLCVEVRRQEHLHAELDRSRGIVRCESAKKARPFVRDRVTLTNR